MKIENLDDHRPHLALHDQDQKKAWCTPLSLLQEVANKERPITDIEDWEDFIPALIKDYLTGYE